MSVARTVFSIVLSVIGVLCLLYGLFGSITAPGSNTVNLGRLAENLTASIWGFGLLITGLLLRRPPAAAVSLHPLLAEQQHTNELLTRLDAQSARQAERPAVNKEGAT